MHRIEDLLLSILSNIISPLILFLLGSLVMKNNTISKFISKTYMSVKEGLELNSESEALPSAEELVSAKELPSAEEPPSAEELPSAEEPPSAKELPSAEEPEPGGVFSIKECSPEDYKESDILERLSKNYGVDNENGWEVRTYYTFTKKQLFNNKLINFKVRDNKFNIYLKTEDLINHFNLKNQKEQISDGAGKIRAYIFQTKKIRNEKEIYIVRFGKKFLENPIKISKL